MNRHVIIGRLGSDDCEPISVRPDENATPVQLVAGRSRLAFGIGRAVTDLNAIGVFPSEIALDLLILAALVYAADTRLSRASESQDTWTREIKLVVPVSDPALWRASDENLQRLLNFLTGDRWTLSFRARPARFLKTIPGKKAGAPSSSFDSLSLFSGGLDSLIGTIDLLESGHKPLLVSHAAEGATSDAQSTLFNALRAHYKDSPFNRFRLWTSFPKNLIRGVTGEDTTRGRSFLFFSAGVFAGSGLGASFTLRVPENGFIALNVPLDPLRLGALSTRTTHPFYIARWNELLRALAISGQITNPYWDKTKGEMIGDCSNAALLRKLIPHSMSCSSPAKGRWRGRPTEHCGYCLPCIIRRASLQAGLQQADPTTYTLASLQGAKLDSSQAEGRQVRSFQYAIERLRTTPSMARLLIHKPGPLSHETPVKQAALADVYRRGLAEVAHILQDVQTETG